MHLRPLALSLLLAAASPPFGATLARAGELIRYRTPNGSIGFVDDEKRLPAGVEVLSRTPLDPPAPRPAAAVEAALPADTALAADAGVVAKTQDAPAPTSGRAGGIGIDCDAVASPLDAVRCRSEHEQRCSHYGLPVSCPPEKIAAAEDWCARGAALRAEIGSLDDERDAARESLEHCRQHGGIRPDCATDELDEAEAAVRTGERRIEALEEQCHAEGCLPGWVREGCNPAPQS